MHPFTIMALIGLGIFLLLIVIVFWPRWLHVSANPVKIRHTLVCLRHGHKWHEGEDTLRTLMGSKDGPFHHGAFTWRCLRCGVTTDIGEPPPPNKSWDHLWVNPMEEPRWWMGEKEPGNCADIYRRRRDREADFHRKRLSARSSEPSAE